ncbi:MAG: glycosyltransferase family 2 protein [Nitrososphaerota archaeon]|nr:glycosyltransferase family 2 protein [Nitrososphaerota archaeon]
MSEGDAWLRLEEPKQILRASPTVASGDRQDAERVGTPFLVACIPCFNEEEHIASVIIRAQEHVRRVIVCDDGSSDMTSKIAERLGAMVIRHDSNLGKGVALADLLCVAKDLGATAVVTMDGDGQHDPGEIPLLIEPIIQGKADVVNGAREKGSGMPNHRKFGNKVLNDMTNRASNGALRDSQSGFRAYSKKALNELAVTEHGIGVESQMIIDALRKGLKVVEVPVAVIYGDDTSTYGSTRHGTYVAGTIVRSILERSPLLYLGVPGLALITFGSLMVFFLVQLYDGSRYFSLPFALLSTGSLILGVLLIIAAMLLYSINNLEVRLRHSG